MGNYAYICLFPGKIVCTREIFAKGRGGRRSSMNSAMRGHTRK